MVPNSFRHLDFSFFCNAHESELDGFCQHEYFAIGGDRIFNSDNQTTTVLLPA